MTNTDNIPVVSLSSFTTSSNATSQQKAAAQLREVLPLNGCVGISGHGVSSQLLTEAFAMIKKFFDLPYEDKMKAPHPEGPFPHRGYSGPGRERVAAKAEAETDNAAEKEEYANTTDVKETFELGSEENKVQENIWLPEEVLPGFRAFMVKFYWELDKTASAVLDALIMSLELTDHEAAAVKALHSVNETQMRLAHYLPIADEGGIKDVSRLGAHTDWSTFTLLFQAEHGGLEFLDRATGDFIPATPIEGVLYMNIGDMFQRISNGLYPSALHRVVGKSASVARYSIPYFVSPAADGVVEPQPSVVAKAGKRVYEPVTQREYSEQQFQRINVRE